MDDHPSFLDHRAIRARGFGIADDCDFVMQECAGCGLPYLGDEETGEVWWDPNDPKASLLSLVEPGCVRCGTSLGALRWVGPDEIARIRSGPWSWTLG
jgi:hypothetical protein